MNSKVFVLLAAVSLVALPSTSRAQCGHRGHADHAGHAADADAQRHGGEAHATAQTIRVALGAGGFSPAEIRLQRGATVTLVVTRTTDETCAKEIVIPDYAVRKALPLNEPVAIELTPAKSGTVRYACGMDMVSGILLVE